MMRLRAVFFVASFIIVAIAGFFVVQYAKGYYFDIKRLSFTQTGILVATSSPDAAQIFINGNLKTATNASLNLVPGNYDIQITKEGYTSWSKRLTITAGVVTKTNSLLFPKAISLSPLTFSGVDTPIISPDFSKLAWIVPARPAGGPENRESEDKTGIWVLDMTNLPFGFAKQARQVADAKVEQGSLSWSADARSLVLSRPNGTFLVDPGIFTKQENLVNLAGKKLEDQKRAWGKFEEKQISSQLKKVPEAVNDLLVRKTSHFLFSPDETKVLYVASSSATIPDNLIHSLPGASTQKQERQTKENQTYIYDIKEDRNFPVPGGVTWFPTSRHLLLAEEDKITILEYDGTNIVPVWSGSYVSPFAFATPDGTQLIILTNLGATNGELPNLYTINLR